MNAELEKGRCLCGRVSYSFNQSDAISAHHCHCKDCQKITGSGKATILLVPSNSLKIEGDLKFFTVSGTAGSSVSRGFCKECGSQLVSFVEENPEIKKKFLSNQKLIDFKNIPKKYSNKFKKTVKDIIV